MSLGYNRVALSGDGFTVANYNDNISLQEQLQTDVIGRGIVSGLVLSVGTGLHLNITDGVINCKSTIPFTSITPYVVPASSSFYVWATDAGAITRTTTLSAPTVNSVCLGYVTTDGSGVTAIANTGRESLVRVVNNGVTFYIVDGDGNRTLLKSTGYVAVPLASTPLTLTAARYACRYIEFTGVLTADIVVTFPLIAGMDWVIINSTTGAHTVTVQGSTGTGVVITQAKISTVFSDGTNIRRATAEL